MAGDRGGDLAGDRGAQPARDLAAQTPAERGTPQDTGARVITVGRLFGVLAILLVPWTAYVALTLPPRARAENYDLAWGGFDVGLVVLLGCTAYAAVRHSTWLAAVAGATAAALVTDAWFDVVTAPSAADRWLAAAMALLVELPLAVVSAWLAVRGQELLALRVRWSTWRSLRERPAVHRKV
ncbi:hypothetical protein [Pedococcus sp. 5OH_020]|uniref:hypothetical protein n=1 Tax=Pedococcus sp. 5OH_020 TaxID=2989814 RepID=UPI0022E9D48D|nr:hypothetical protein [Pedococcus sp. 5OH_020]